MSTEYIDLLMDNGELVRIKCPNEYYDECHEAIDNARKSNSWWSTSMFQGCHATYMGIFIDRVNMARVVAML